MRCPCSRPAGGAVLPSRRGPPRRARGAGAWGRVRGTSRDFPPCGRALGGGTAPQGGVLPPVRQPTRALPGALPNLRVTPTRPSRRGHRLLGPGARPYPLLAGHRVGRHGAHRGVTRRRPTAGRAITPTAPKCRCRESRVRLWGGARAGCGHAGVRLYPAVPGCTRFLAVPGCTRLYRYPAVPGRIWPYLACQCCWVAMTTKPATAMTIPARTPMTVGERRSRSFRAGWIRVSWWVLCSHQLRTRWTSASKSGLG